MEIKGKVALVLGATKGIGKAIGIALAKEGAKVAFPYHDWPEESQQTIQEFNALDEDHLAVKVDLRDPEQVKELINQIRRKFGKLHILINNIERGGMPIVHGPYVPDQWDLEMETTLKAKWWVFHHALSLLKSSDEGIVVNISSIAGHVGRSGPASLIFNDGYAAANRAVSSFTETWARQAYPNVRVNELMLGFIETRHAETTRGWELLSDQQKKDINDNILLRRTGRLDEVVKAVFFLIQDATYMTGTVMRMDGGYVLGGATVTPMPKGVL